MSLKRETIAIQSELADYCRTGRLPHPIEGVRTDRLPHYRRLVFNVVRGTLEQAYPITCRILQAGEWEMVVEDFFEEHPCQSYRLWHMPYEFYQYACEKDYASGLNRPYLSELLFFEWMEIEVHTMEDPILPEWSLHGSFENDRVLLNPCHRLLRLSWPVHSKPASELAENRGNYFVLAYRDLETGKVKFIELNALSALLFEKIKEQTMTVPGELLKNLVANPNEEIYKQALAFLGKLLRQGVILGFNPS